MPGFQLFTVTGSVSDVCRVPAGPQRWPLSTGARKGTERLSPWQGPAADAATRLLPSSAGNPPFLPAGESLLWFYPFPQNLYVLCEGEEVAELES